MTKRNPVRFTPAPHPERVLKLDGAGIAAAARHISEGKNGRRFMPLPSFFEGLASTGRLPRAPYLDGR